MGCVSVSRLPPEATVTGIFGDPKARVITLPAGKKTACGTCGRVQRRFYDRKPRRVRDLSCGDTRVYLDFEVRRVDCRRCGSREAANGSTGWPTTRSTPSASPSSWAGAAGPRPIQEVAEELHLDWHTVKELDKQYMREQLRRAGTPGPRVIGIDEIAIAQGAHATASWSATWSAAGRSGSAARTAPRRAWTFFAWLGPENAAQIRLAVMDMWKAFRNSTLKAGNAPQASILYDKFHILRHLGEAMDKVRKSEYARLIGRRTGASSRGRSTRCCRTGRT